MNFFKTLRTPIIFAFLPASALAIAFKLLGWLQPLELLAYDWFFQLRPPEGRDERIVIVGLQEGEMERFYPISDSTLAKLLLKVREQEPNVIGLDLFRDISVGRGGDELERVFRTTPNLYGGKKSVGPERVPAHPALEELGQVATGDQLHDADGIVRRSLLQAENRYENSVYSLGTTLALLYLQDRGIFPERTPDGLGIQLGDVRLYRLKEFDGGYHKAQSGGYQILVNFRDPERGFKRVSFSDVMDGKIPKDLFRDRIVIVGTTAASIKDQFFIPYSRTFSGVPQPIYGSEYVAHEASNLVSAVLDGRPTIKLLPHPWQEAALKYGFILGWGLLATVTLWNFKDGRTVTSFLLFSISPLVLAGGIFGTSFLAFLWGWWLPFVPALLEVSLVFALTAFLILRERVRSYRELLAELEAAQGKILAGQRQKVLSEILSGVAHEINNPLNFVENYAEFSRNWLDGLSREMESLNLSGGLSREGMEGLQSMLDPVAENLGEIVNYSRKASGITKLLLRQSNARPSEPAPTDVNRLIASVFDICCYSRSRERDCPIERRSELGAAVGERAIAAEELTGCLINLFNNACDAVIEKKGSSGADFCPTVFVRSAISEDGGSLEVQVGDNGIGIGEEAAASLFSPFFTTKKEGTGLGLYLSQQAVGKHGGSISWHREGDWTVFSLSLPLEKP